MANINDTKRPSCEKILEERNSWALSKNEFDYDNELESFEEPKNENQFVYSIIIQKLNQ